MNVQANYLLGKRCIIAYKFEGNGDFQTNFLRNNAVGYVELLKESARGGPVDVLNKKI